MNFIANTDPNTPSIFDRPSIKKRKSKKKPSKIGSKKADALRWTSYPQNEMSAAEYRIDTLLKGYRVRYFREVSFESLKSDVGGYLRFDFYLPDINLCIEYDGADYHTDIDVQIRDQRKTAFCRKKSITLIRFNRIHWYNLDTHIDRVMINHKVKGI